MKTVYELTSWRWQRCGIEKIQVERSTKASVWINGRRRQRISEGVYYFDTEIEAAEHLEGDCLEKWERAAKTEVRARFNLDAARALLATVKTRDDK